MCLWQINGRSDVSFEKLMELDMEYMELDMEYMELDMEYIDKLSPWLDTKIIMKTIPAVLKGNGAV